MLKDETNEKLQDVAFDIEQALKEVGDKPTSYELGLFEGKMIGLSVMLNAVAADINDYCQYGNSEERMQWIPYERASKIEGPHAIITTGGVVEVRDYKASQYGAHVTHYLMLPELPNKENEDAKS